MGVGLGVCVGEGVGALFAFGVGVGATSNVNGFVWRPKTLDKYYDYVTKLRQRRAGGVLVGVGVP